MLVIFYHFRYMYKCIIMCASRGEREREREREREIERGGERENVIHSNYKSDI